MATANKRAPTPGSEYSRCYRDMRGVDFSSASDSTVNRFAMLENMYRDYDSGDGEAIESIPGFRKLFSTSGSINGVFLQRTADGNEFIIIHDTNQLFRLSLSDPSSVTKIIGIGVVNNARSHAFRYGGALYFADGMNLYLINDNGAARLVSNGLDTEPYIPTVYKNGQEYEEFNLMTSRYYERFEMTPTAAYARGTASLTYRILDPVAMTCSVSGITDKSETVYIPASVRIGEKVYTVTEIGNSAFSRSTSIVNLILSDTVKRIGVGAFYFCTSLQRISGGEGLLEIDTSAFSGSTLKEIYIPSGFKRFGVGAFSSNDVTISYGLDSDTYHKIENAPSCTILFGRKLKDMAIGVNLRAPTKKIISVDIDGTAQNYSYECNSAGFVTQVKLDTDDKDSLTGKTVSVLCEIDELSERRSEYGTDFSARSAKKKIALTSSVTRCTRSATVDGRVFVWGNPTYPSVVFYSKSTFAYDGKLYFGSLDYFEDGTDGREVISVIGLPEGIAVFTAAIGGEEAIFFHPSEDQKNSPQERRYPVTETHRGDAAVGEAILFYDDPVFMTTRGLLALGQRSLDLSRSVELRSSLVNPRLLTEDIATVSMALWRGYLAISVDGRIYLADSRATFNGTSGKEYEWFFLSGIGTYTGDSRVYRYAATAHDGYAVSTTPDSPVTETVYSEDTGGGLVYFVNSDEGKIEVYPTEEMTGGQFHPANRLISVGSSLLFTTDSGDLCIFNDDKRGVIPDSLLSDPDFDPSSYLATMGRRIHSDFYDFAGHAPRYALETFFDDCDLPHMAKSTVPGSLTVKLKTFTGSQVKCAIGRDHDGFRQIGEFDGGVTDLSRLSFASLPFSSDERATVTLRERERGWVEKSVALYSDRFRSPMGIYSTSFRYRIKGRIRYI